VIQAMADEGFITQVEADGYKESPIQTKITKTRQGCEANQSSAFFCDFTVWTIRNSTEFGETAEDREMLLRRGGLEIYTTLDLDVQEVAFNATMDQLPGDNEWAFGTASVSVEVGTGRVLAMVQNRFFDQSDNPEPGRTSVNFNTDKPYGGSSGFQPGSTYKVFTLAEWLKSGYTLGDHVDGRIFTGEDVDLDGAADKVKIWNVEKDFRASCGGVVGLWEVNNSGDQTIDDLSVRQAVITSQNTAFAAMASKLDLCAIRDTAASFGVHRADGTELLYVPATILGTNEIAPLTMAAAYAGISNNGTVCSPVAIDKVILRGTNEELEVPKTICSQAVSPDIAHAMVEALRGVVSGGTGAAANPGDGTPLAGKTGTTDQRIHTWMNGFSSKVATATWVGNVSGLTSQSSKSVNGRAVSTIRHSIWKEIMTEVNKRYVGEAFPAALPQYTAATMITIPNTTGIDLESAKLTITGAQLNIAIQKNEVSSSAPAGTVAYTIPAAGQTIARGSIVKVFISAGGKQLVPNVRGLELNQAKANLEAMGFTVSLPQSSQSQLKQCDPALAEGVANSTLPAAGSEISANSAIVLIPNQCG
jgi:membrane peptidoglycan carboxypeptidase